MSRRELIRRSSSCCTAPVEPRHEVPPVIAREGLAGMLERSPEPA